MYGKDKTDLLELKFPLQDRHSVRCETDDRLFDGLSCRDTRQGFSGTTRQLKREIYA